MSMRPSSVLLAVAVALAPPSVALAGAKDESAAEWLPIPKEFNDWRNALAEKLPAGGPAPPIAVPGIRLKAKVTDDITAFAARQSPAGRNESRRLCAEHRR